MEDYSIVNSVNLELERIKESENYITLKTFCKGLTGLDFDTLTYHGKRSCLFVYLSIRKEFPYVSLRDLIYEAGLRGAIFINNKEQPQQQ